MPILTDEHLQDRMALDELRRYADGLVKERADRLVRELDESLRALQDECDEHNETRRKHGKLWDAWKDEQARAEGLAKVLREVLDDGEAYWPTGQPIDHDISEYVCPWCEKRTNGRSDEKHDNDCTGERARRFLSSALADEKQPFPISSAEADALEECEHGIEGAAAEPSICPGCCELADEEAGE